ncbi:hypothetical protein [Cohnella rhizosphaerae]|uniref:Uncharacterized protein n=1 Tax=Cohnella rhizosphaerae TaxID=1457232 RepID=A0A9X4QW36_9BACL|nr:hypothetical protein [Cohnella rhizosphaerae]MDG0813224.1 hypothetical protein [Cohnella rhizosphaerae]
MSFFDEGPLPDWRAIRQLLGKDLPWDLVKQWEHQDHSWLNDYIRKLGFGNSGEKTAASAGVGPEAYVTASPQMEARKEQKRVVATIKPPPGTDRGAIRMYATADRLRVSGLPGEATASLKLPCLVLPKTGRVVWKNGKWVVVFSRKPPRQGEVELFIGE